MNIEKMREEFETWSAEHYYLTGCSVDLNEDGEYVESDMQYSWDAWQASREALVIELPSPAVPGSSCIREHAIRDTLESAGVKVKP